MENNVYEFIKSGLETFSDDGGIYNRELKETCLLPLNELLNNVEVDDYEEHIIKKLRQINIKIKTLFEHINFDEQMVIDLQYFLKYLEDLQNLGELGKNRYRDHFLHSIQSFLLLIRIITIDSINSKVVIDKNIVFKLFSIAANHDIGYLYQVGDKDLFFNSNPNILIRKKLLNLVEYESNGYDSNFEDEKELISKVFGIKKEDLRLIDNIIIDRCWNKINWYNPIEFFNLGEEKLLATLTQIIGTLNYILDPKDFNKIEKIIQHHSVTGAAFLYRILSTRKSIFNNCFQKDMFNEILEEVIQAVLIHDLTNIDSKMCFSTHPLSSLMIIVDEIQTYGRLYKSGSERKPINPKYVGFRWDNTNKKLILENDKGYLKSITNTIIRNEYQKHTNESVLTELKTKIKEEDLEFLRFE